MTQSESGNPDLRMKALVVADDATRSKIVDNYLKQNGHKNAATPENGILPKAIFWLKKKMGFSGERRE